MSSSDSTPQASDAILEVNPYEGDKRLSHVEAEVLWEYAKLAHHVKDLTSTARRLTEGPDAQLLAKLRVLESKIGLVFTLLRASVWGVINEQAPLDADADQDQDVDADLDVTARYADSSADTTIRR